MYYVILFVISFISFNYNILSIWFSFFLSLSCYLSPFLWENQFFFSDSSLSLINNFFISLNKDSNLYNYIENFYYVNSISNLYLYNNDFLSFNQSITDFSLSINLNKFDTNNNFYLLWLEATCSRNNLIDFYCLQQQQILLAGETSLSFYRIYNKSLKDILFYSVYLINPPNLSLYLVKVQCFCFEEILIGSDELINLPILIYLDNVILLENKLNWINLIYLEYIALIKEI